jgi:uncharacterized Zn finger protein (UPF0148 family)
MLECPHCKTRLLEANGMIFHCAACSRDFRFVRVISEERRGKILAQTLYLKQSEPALPFSRFGGRYG